MKAIRIVEYGGQPQIKHMEAPRPDANQVVVRNEVTSFNPIDPGRASGGMRQIFPLQFPWVPGGDVAGIVESVGKGVTGFQVGDAVFGYNMLGGAYAELVAIDAGAITKRPASLTAEQAASIAVVGRTAVQMLEMARLQSGQTVLVQGGSGGVGTLVIQLAHKLGARVLTTAQSSQKDALLQLGADTVIDYASENLAERASQVDVVLDLVGGKSLAEAYALIKRGGVLVTANQPPDPKECETRGIEGMMVQSKVTTEGLQELLRLVAAGDMVPVVDHTQSLWEVDKLWEKPAPGTVVGKVVYAIVAS